MAIDKTIIGQETLPDQRILKYGARDPITGQRYEEVINASMLQPSTAIDYQTPNEVPFYPVAGLGSDTLEMTAPEQNVQDIIGRLQGMNQELVGQSAYRAEQEQTQGLPALQTTQKDLTARLTALKNEALAIPMQLQQEAQGRGITTGGLQPLQTAALRNNAIQALSINSLLAASQGNLTTALDMVDKAVKQKFDPIKEAIATTTANLDLILKSPEYTLAEKNRAQKQLDIQNAKKAEAEAQAELMKNINAVGMEAAKYGADAGTLNNILNASSLQEAIYFAGDSLGAEFKQKAEELAFNQQIKIEELGIKKAELAISQAGLKISQGNLSLAWAKFKADEAKGKTISTSVIDNPTGTGKMLINSQTGEVIRDYGVDPTTGKALTPANDLKKDALTSAQQLLDKFNAKQGTSIVGSSRIFTFGKAVPGTAAADFQVQFDNLKGKISLDNVKYLKGQGQVSDAERKLLAEASSKLNLSQSEAEFKKSIEEIIMSLSGNQSQDTYSLNGKNYVKGADGLYYEQ